MIKRKRKTWRLGRIIAASWSAAASSRQKTPHIAAGLKAATKIGCPARQLEGNDLRVLFTLIPRSPVLK
jgi:hypothetical protein